jgi:tight adherence protein C
MLILIFILVFVSVFLLAYSFVCYLQRDKMAVYSRLENIRKFSLDAVDADLNQPLFSRVLKPLLDSFGKTIMKITPKELLISLESKVVKAGYPGNMSVKDWVNLQAGIMVGLPILTFILGAYFKISVGKLFFFAIAEMIFGYVIPSFILGKKMAERQKAVQNSLPDTIDLLTVSVEAGLGFDGALMKVVDKKTGPLASEFEKVLQEIKVGKQKKDALKDMADRVGLQDLTTFIGAIIQADQFGVGIANILRIQAEQMRQKRRQRAQEKAMKAPIKMLIPMVIFIFPTLFIVLLGPVVLQLIDQFAK